MGGIAALSLLVLSAGCGGGGGGDGGSAERSIDVAAQERAGGPNELPFTDDFSDCSRWSTHENELVSLGCVDGAYRILIKGPPDVQTATIFLTTGAEGLSVEADAAYETGPENAGYENAAYGVSCWASDRGYLFLVSPDGTWAIVKATEGTAPSVLAASKTEGVIEGFSATNRIRGECFGGGEEPTALALHVNGKRIATAEDPDGLTSSFGEVGISVLTSVDEGGMDVRFDNFAARNLDAKPHDRPPPAKTFEGGGYSFTYPGTWVKRADTKYDIRIVPADRGGSVSLIVHRDVLTTPVTPANIDQAVRANRPAVDAYVEGADAVLDSGPTKLTYAGLPGLGFEASLTVAGQPTHERGTWLFDGTTVYVFRCLFIPAQAEEVGQACDLVLSSFQLSD